MGRSITIGTVFVFMLGGLFCAVPSGADTSPWWGEWIWQPEPTKTNYFRHVFTVTDEPVEANLAITADNIYTLFINGREVGHDDDWTTLELYDIRPYIQQGDNILAVIAVDPGPDIGALLIEGSVNYADDSFTHIKSSTSWKISKEEQPGWKELDFDDSDWSNPISFGTPPVGPWGGIPYPDLIPKTIATVSDLEWPERAMPGDDIQIAYKITPSRKPIATGPLGLRLILRGERVFEHWIAPPTPITDWQSGQPVQINIHTSLPVYLPSGEMEVEFLVHGMTVEKTFPVKVGRFVEPDPPAVRVLSLDADASDGRVNVRTTISIFNGSAPESGLYLQLYRGKELWHAENIPISSESAWKSGAQIREEFSIDLPEIPSGSYRLSVCPHNTVCMRCTSTPVYLAIHNEARGQNAKPLGYGVFTDRYGVPHRWHVDRKGVMIWDGEPYIPVGAMYLSTFFMGFNSDNPRQNERNFNNDVEKLRMMMDAGITDLYMNPCAEWHHKPHWVWQRIVDLFDEMGLKYGLQLTQPVDRLTGYAITTEDYNVPAPSSGTHGMDIVSGWYGRINPDSPIMYALFDTDTGDLLASGRARTRPIGNGLHAEVDVTLSEGQTGLVHFIPEMTFHGDMHDYWTSVNDEYFEKLDLMVGRLRLGSNFRMFIDILDNEQSWRDMSRMLPNPDAFRTMFADALQTKHGTPELVSAEWGLNPAVKSFAEASSLVPVGRASNVTNDGWAVDFETGTQYHVNMAVSRMWYDMVNFRDWSVRDYNNLVADFTKARHDAPVVLKLTDTDSFTNDKTVGGFDGVGMEAYGTTGELIRGSGGGVYSRSRQANRTIWELVTETGLAEDYVGYPDPLRLMEEIGAMVSIGAKGTYYFYLNAGGDTPGQGFYIFNLFCDTRQLGWMGAFSKLIKSSSRLLTHDPYPDFMYPGMIAGEHGFRRYDLDYEGTIPPISIKGDSGQWVVPSTTPPPGERVIVNLTESPATRIHGPIVEQLLDDHEVVVVGHRRNLGAMSFDKYYKDEFTELPDGRVIQVLKPSRDAKVIERTSDGKVYHMQIGNLTLYSKDDWQRSVREMAGTIEPEDFFRDILGTEILDLGPAFQGITDGRNTFVWLLGDEPAELTIDTREEISIYRNGVAEQVRGPIKLSPKPNAESTEHIVMDGVPRFTGIDEANLKVARTRWTQAAEGARAEGLQIGAMPSDWRTINADAERIERQAYDVTRTTTAVRMDDVTIDGDLSEWADVEPIRMRIEILRDFSREVDYQDAEFYLGWDDEHLYVAARVKDPIVSNNYRGNGLWQGDSIEVFIETDPENDPFMHAYDLDTYQYLFSPTNADGVPDMAVGGNPYLRSGYRPEANRVAAVITDDGWTIECAIHYTEMGNWNPEAGARIGFTMAMNDSNGMERIRQLMWYGKGDASRNRTRFGRLLFVD